MRLDGFRNEARLAEKLSGLGKLSLDFGTNRQTSTKKVLSEVAQRFLSLSFYSIEGTGPLVDKDAAQVRDQEISLVASSRKNLLEFFINETAWYWLLKQSISDLSHTRACQ